METYTTNSFCNNVLNIQTPFPMLKITFLYKFSYYNYQCIFTAHDI